MKAYAGIAIPAYATKGVYESDEIYRKGTKRRQGNKDVEVRANKGVKVYRSNLTEKEVRQRNRSL
jgi:hypothetical protein